ncbi:Protein DETOXIFICATION 21 [Senna tora]|uniref:Protein DETOXIFICATION 21 n=1 Tax=Senna tora TaxID=362788 RepID=A0A834WDC8_9FABA|nr:Protein DETOXIFICATION 21 [Senna tora]
MEKASKGDKSPTAATTSGLVVNIGEGKLDDRAEIFESQKREALPCVRAIVGDKVKLAYVGNPVRQNCGCHGAIKPKLILDSEKPGEKYVNSNSQCSQVGDDRVLALCLQEHLAEPDKDSGDNGESSELNGANMANEGLANYDDTKC